MIDKSAEVNMRGDPVTHEREFRRCLGQFATGVAVITTEVDGRRAGVTVNSFSSVSLDPPLILWSIGKSSRSFLAFDAAEGYAVNLLSADQVDVSRHFSSSIDDKFADIDWIPGNVTGMPLIRGAVAHFECRRESTHDGGDHVVHFGHVERFEQFEGEPLLFAQGKYSVAANHPDIRLTEEPARTYDRTTGNDDDILSLIFDAYNSLSERFAEHRLAEDTNVAEGRVLRRLYDNPGLSPETLEHITYLGRRDTEDAIAELIRRSWINSDSLGRLFLTEEGRHRREAIIKRWQEFKVDQVEPIPHEQLRCAKMALAGLIHPQTD